MIYTKYFIRDRQTIPVSFTIIVIVAMIIFISRVITTRSTTIKASETKVDRLTVANVLHNQAGIFWQTDKKESGWVAYGESETLLEKTASDERDTTNDKNDYLNHFVAIKNLQEKTRYYFKLVSNNGVITDKDGKPFSFMTAQKNDQGVDLAPAYGKIIKSNGESVEFANVLLIVEKAIPLHSFSKSSGEWLIPLRTLVNNSTLSNLVVEPDEKVKVEIFSEKDGKTLIEANLSDISPLPQTIIIGRNYGFVNEKNILPASTRGEQGSTQKKEEKIDIVFPKDGALIPGNTPLIKGTALPNQEVAILVKAGEERSYKAVTNKEGEWSVLVEKSLPTGNYTLTMKTKGKEGKEVRLERKFTIAKSGEQVLAAATSEATPTIKPTMPSTPSPTQYTSPTSFYSPYPTVPLTPTPPVSGSELIPYSLILSGSLIILGLGVLLAF